MQTYLLKPYNITFILLSLFYINKDSFAQSAFIENKGQWDKKILLKSNFKGGSLYIEDAAFNFNFFDTKEWDTYIDAHHKNHNYEFLPEVKIKGHCLKTQFVDAQFDKMLKQSKQKEYFNFYLGKNKANWASNVNAYRQVLFEEVYSEIDLKLKLENGFYKYDFIVKANADVSLINIKYLGSDSVYLFHDNLKIETSVNELIELKPIAYQYLDGKKELVSCKFKIKQGKVSFEFPNGYDKSKSLVIDPTIVFARYSSSFADNFGYSATYDSEGNAYGAGSVFSSGYITTPGAFDQSFNGAATDIGIVKYSPDGLQRLYSTYLGGNNTELPHSLIVNSRDELYVLGTTSSLDFPIANPQNVISNNFNGGQSITISGLNTVYQNGSDLLVARFSVDGTNLISSSYIGGSGNDGINSSFALKYNYADEIRGEILIDDSDNCYIVSCTNSEDFPLANAFQTFKTAGLDAIVMKVDENLTSIIWSSYLGGEGDDAAYSVDFDPQNNLIVAGGTHSEFIWNVNSLQTNYGGGAADGFISKIHASGGALLSSTFYGTTGYDQIYFVEVNDTGEVFVFGQTTSPSGSLISNAAYNTPNGGQFIAKFDQSISNVVWSTRFGDGAGLPDISPTAFLVDVCNRIFISGWGWGADNNINGTNGLDVTSDALDNTTDNQDFYFMVMKDDASGLEYASYFGGNSSSEHVDGGTSRFDQKGVIYQAICAGCGSNQDFPTVPSDSAHAWPNNSQNCNLGVVKYEFTPPSLVADFTTPLTDCVPITLDFINQSKTAFNDTSSTIFTWIVNNDTINSYHLNYTFLNSGVYNIQLIAYDPSSCNLQNTITKQITILGNGKSNLPDIKICPGGTAQIGINPIGQSNISYAWSPNYFISNTNIANPFVNPQVDTSYTLLVSNGNCTDTLIQKVMIDSINLEIQAYDSICLESSGTISASYIDGALYEWTPEELIISGQTTNTIEFYAESSNPELNLKMTTVDGCTKNLSFNVNTIDDLPDITVAADPEEVQSGQSSQLLVSSIQGDIFLWEANNHFDDLTIENPKAENILETTTFYVSVNDGVCPKRDSVQVRLLIPNCLQGDFFVPNAFSPNNDQNNDVFKVHTSILNIQNFHLSIYDRWGNMVFESFDVQKGWDGLYKGQELSPNVYGWQLTGLCPNNEKFVVKGNLTLLK